MTAKRRRRAGLGPAVLSLISSGLLVVTLNAAPAWAQSSVPRLEVPRLTGPIKLDGFSDEPAWEAVAPLPLTVQAPVFGGAPSQPSEIRLAYDQGFLYVAGRMWDDPALIQTTSLKRDDLTPSSDYLVLILDTFNDEENALAFATTPAGIRLDFTVYNDAIGEFPINESWNTYWDAAVKVTDEGWFAEMRIPLSSLRFQTVDGEVTMGALLWRYMASRNETHIYPDEEPNWGFWSAFKPSQGADLVFEGLTPSSPVYLTPYALGGTGFSWALNDPETAWEQTSSPQRNVGLDLKYGLTPNLTLDLTLNTDFAQVEADDQQVNLTRFSLFFPEKRRFFQERASVFDVNLGGRDQLFYSRRIGLEEGEQVPIVGGARLVGRVGLWDVGLMDMQTRASAGLPGENFGVVRLRRRVFNDNSYLGAMTTSRVGNDGSYNLAYGLDGIIRFGPQDFLLLNWAETFEDTLSHAAGSPQFARSRIALERRVSQGPIYDLSYSRSGKDYRPGIGFSPREDYNRWGNRLGWGWVPVEGSPIQRHTLTVDGGAFLRNADGSLETMSVGPHWNAAFRSGASMDLFPQIYHEDLREDFELSDDVVVPPGGYHFMGLNATYNTPEGLDLRAVYSLNIGEFFDGRRITASIQPNWVLTRVWSLSGRYEFSRIDFPSRDDTFVAHVARIRLQATLSVVTSAVAFIQYNSAADRVITNLRFRWNPREGTDLYVVYNEGYFTDRFDYSPVRPFTSDRTLLVKYSYTFIL